MQRARGRGGNRLWWVFRGRDVFALPRRDENKDENGNGSLTGGIVGGRREPRGRWERVGKACWG